jgi:hypothetical protein
MKLEEMLEQVRMVCRMRRLSMHTEVTYAGWIARFGAHVKACGDEIPAINDAYSMRVV